MSDATFRDDDESLHYAMARYVCQWLDEHFARVVGKTPRDADAAWATWVRRL